MYHSISALYGYSLCCITLTLGPPYSQSGEAGGWRAPKEREQVSKELTTAPPSFQLHPPPSPSSLYTLIFSLFALYSALGADWPDHDGNQPGPSVKASPAIRPSPPGTPPLLAFANFLPSPCSSPQQHYNPLRPHPTLAINLSHLTQEAARKQVEVESTALVTKNSTTSCSIYS